MSVSTVSIEFSLKKKKNQKAKNQLIVSFSSHHDNDKWNENVVTKLMIKLNNNIA